MVPRRPIASGISFNEPNIFDPASGIPVPSILDPLLDLFFEHSSQHYPFINRHTIDQRLQEGTMSEFLLIAICAIASRFHDDPRLVSGPTPADNAKVFIEKASSLVVPLLRIPSVDVVAGLLLLATVEFGQNSESGLWMYSGMAIRMSVDLGLHKLPLEESQSVEEQCSSRLLFWALFIKDRILSFGTGRPVCIPEDEITVPFPEDTDIEGCLGAFPKAVRLMMVGGRISNILNRDPPCDTLIANLREELIELHNGLPLGLKWSVGNLKAHTLQRQGAIFIFLHLWANYILTIIHHPGLLRRPGEATPLNVGGNSLELALASARRICDCITHCELVSLDSYLANPFVSQAMFAAGCAFVHECRIRGFDLSMINVNDAEQSSKSFLQSLAREHANILLSALQRQTRYWSGVCYISNVLEQRAAGLPKINFETTSDNSKTYVSMPDKGMLKKFTSPNAQVEGTEFWPDFMEPSVDLEGLLTRYNINDILASSVDSTAFQNFLMNTTM